jgi:hypothetical protein
MRTKLLIACEINPTDSKELFYKNTDKSNMHIKDMGLINWKDLTEDLTLCIRLFQEEC